jgi:integrase
MIALGYDVLDAPLGAMVSMNLLRLLSLKRVPRTAAIIEQMLEELKDLRRSQRHIYGLKQALRPFAAAFPDIRKVSYQNLALYLRALNVGGRRRDNIRASIVELFRYARKHGILDELRRSAAERIPQIKPGHEVLTWAPQEARLLLENACPIWLPCIAIGLFAGLRKSEILRLDWSAFKWELGVIAVQRRIARKSKVDRLVPIQPNLMSWLEPYPKIGPLYPGSFKTAENAYSLEMKRIRATAGLPRKDNANRHSFGSYRLAVTQSYDQVALEMGNSREKVRESYNDPKSPTEGLEYFAISRGGPENIITMPLPLEFIEQKRERV